MPQLTDLFLSQISFSKPDPNEVCGRYAPSPTGPLHFGNLRTALIAWLQARLSQGRFILRIEDIDVPRTRPGAAEQIIKDLRWLGLDWDEGPDIVGAHAPYTQSKRFELYQSAINFLQQTHHLYECYCSRKDIAQAASAPHRSNQPIIYPGTCRPNNTNAAKKSSRQQASLRFLCPDKIISFNDHILAHQVCRLREDVGDFVIKRADGLFSYHLAVTLDDALMGVSDVVRGEDLLDPTAQQILLLETLGLPVPNYWHIPLVLDKDTGKRLSKRDGALSIQHFMAQGLDGPGLIGQLASSIGLVPENARLSAQELLEEINLSQLIHCLKHPPRSL